MFVSKRIQTTLTLVECAVVQIVILLIDKRANVLFQDRIGRNAEALAKVHVCICVSSFASALSKQVSEECRGLGDGTQSHVINRCL